MVISFLGAGVFAGLWAVAPNMERVGDEYYSSQNVHDVRLLSTYGFTDADVDAIRQVDGVSGVMASHYVDASGTVGDKDYTFRVDGLPSSATQSGDGTSDDADYINQMTLVEGRMPQADNECVIVQSSTGLKNIEVGSIIKLSDGSSSSLDDTLANRELTVVGVVDSADYVSFTVGNTNVGSGTINYVLYVPDSNFTVDGYTDLYVTVDGASSLDQFRQAYLDKVAQTTTSLDELKQERQTLRHDSLWNDLNSAWDEYNAKKADADQSLADALDQLNQGADQIASARDQYAAGQAEYDEKSASAQQQLSSAADQLASAAQQIDAGQSQIDSKESEYSSGANQLAAARQTLDAGESQYSENYAAYQQAASELVSAREQLDAVEQTYSDNLATWQQNSDEYEAGEKSYSAAADKLSQQRSALDEKQQQYQTALQAAQAMEEGSQKQALLSQLEQTKAQLDAAESAYSSAADELS